MRLSEAEISYQLSKAENEKVSMVLVRSLHGFKEGNLVVILDI